jgi:hypothetical protein
MRNSPVWAARIVLSAAAAAWAGQVRIAYVSELAFDQPRVGVYLKDADGEYLPPYSGGYVLPGLLDTGAAGHVLPKYLQDLMLTPLDPTGSAEVLTLCGYTEFLDLSQKVYVGVGPAESENEADYVEMGPQRIAVRRVDPEGAALLGFPMIVGTPFFWSYAAGVSWQLIEIWPGIELPMLVVEVRPAGPPPSPLDLTLPVTMLGETNNDPEVALPTANSVPFVDVILWNGSNRQRKQFIVDTGAQISFFSTELAEALGVDLAHPVDAGLPVTGAGTCDLTIYPYYVDEMILPTSQGVSLVFEQPMIYVLDVPGIDGGIGSNMLFFFDELDGVDIDLADRNIGIDLNVPIPPAGDVNSDGLVTVTDLINVLNGYGSRPGDAGYDERRDIDGDGLVDVSDLLCVINDFGKGSQ